MKHSNGALNPKRWSRAREAEGELLALLDADPFHVDGRRDFPRGTLADRSAPQKTTGGPCESSPEAGRTTRRGDPGRNEEPRA